MQRRNFLKLLSLAVGTSISGGCGSGGDFTDQLGHSPLPISYQFIPVVRSGQTLPNGRAFLGQTNQEEPPFLGAVMINNKRQIAFHAADQTESRGIYKVEYEASSGRTSDIGTIIHEGQVLADGTVVDEFSDGDLNDFGDFLVQVEDPEGDDSLQYCPDGGEFRRLAENFQNPSTDFQYSGEICECQALSNDGRVLFVAEYLDEEGDAEGEGLFCLEIGQADQPLLLFRKEQLLPSSSSTIQTIVAAEVGPGGRFLVQGSAAPTTGNPPEGKPLTYLVTGLPGESPQVLAADPSLGVSSEGVIQASCFMGPRMKGNQFATITQTDPNQTELRLNQQLLLQADFESGGTLSPRGSQIISMFPPVFGPDGLMFLQIFTKDGGTEVVAYSGNRFRTILAKGDLVGGKVVEDIMFGALPESVNSHGELTAAVFFADGETAILLGMPL